MKRTYETCGKEFTSRKAADDYARNIANALGSPVPVYETTGFNVGCDKCGVADRKPGSEYCQYCEDQEREAY